MHGWKTNIDLYAALQQHRHGKRSMSNTWAHGLSITDNNIKDLNPINWRSYSTSSHTSITAQQCGESARGKMERSTLSFPALVPIVSAEKEITVVNDVIHTYLRLRNAQK